MNQPKSIFKNAISPDKLSKHQRKLMQMQKVSDRKGSYLFENNTQGDLYLPRPTAEGVRSVKKDGRFIGDDYYFQMVKTNELKFIEELKMKEEKLITEQPPTITPKGAVEQVVEAPQQTRMDEEEDKTPKPDILLTESPIDSITIISI